VRGGEWVFESRLKGAFSGGEWVFKSRLKGAHGEEGKVFKSRLKRAHLACAVTLGVLSLLPVVAAAPGPAAEVRVTARREGDVVLVEAQAEPRADLHLAWGVLTDYDRYAEFIPDLQSSRVLVRDTHTALIEQHGTAGFFLFRFPLEVRLAVTEEPFERVISKAVAGNFKELSGVYELTAAGERVRLVYHGRLVPTFRLPPLIGLPALRASVERQFGGLVREIERRSAAASEPAPR